MRSAVDAVVQLLGDSRPHSFAEIMEKEGIPRDQLDKVVRFLLKYEIAERVGDYIQLAPDFRPLASVGSSKGYRLKKLAR